MKDDVTKQLMLKEFFNKPRESKAVHYVVRAPKQGMFEIRVQNKYGKLNSRKKVEEKRVKLLDKFHSLS
jgi:DNA-directed RNA polymerase subunit L